jgi:hypothetical protein
MLVAVYKKREHPSMEDASVLEVHNATPDHLLLFSTLSLLLELFCQANSVTRTNLVSPIGNSVSSNATKHNTSKKSKGTKSYMYWSQHSLCENLLWILYKLVYIITFPVNNYLCRLILHHCLQCFCSCIYLSDTNFIYGFILQMDLFIARMFPSEMCVPSKESSHCCD